MKIEIIFIYFSYYTADVVSLQISQTSTNENIKKQVSLQPTSLD